MSFFPRYAAIAIRSPERACALARVHPQQRLQGLQVDDARLRFLPVAGKTTLKLGRHREAVYTRSVGDLAADRVVQEIDDLTIITSNGMVLRTKVKDVKQAGRATRGVHLMEFGSPEAIWELEVRDFPVVVTMDSHGASLHRDLSEASGARLREILISVDERS